MGISNPVYPLFPVNAEPRTPRRTRETFAPRPARPVAQVAGAGDQIMSQMVKDIFGGAGGKPEALKTAEQEYLDAAKAHAALRIARKNYRPEFSYDTNIRIGEEPVPLVGRPIGGMIARYKVGQDAGLATSPENLSRKQAGDFWDKTMKNFMDQMGRARSGANLTAQEWERIGGFIPHPEYDDYTNQTIFDDLEEGLVVAKEVALRALDKDQRETVAAEIEAYIQKLQPYESPETKAAIRRMKAKQGGE